MRTLPDSPYDLDFPSRVIQFVYERLNRMKALPSDRRYNLTLSHENRFIWFRVAKVASRTIYNHLKEHRVHMQVEHAISVHYQPRRYDNYFKFAMVRNPWDRVVSIWANRVIEKNRFRFAPAELERMKDFENFVHFLAGLKVGAANVHLQPQSSIIDLNNLSFLGRLENFDHDFQLICKRINIPGALSQARNKSNRLPDYRGYFSAETRDIVGRVYAKDIQLFNYEF